jgi:hypothetical protein
MSQQLRMVVMTLSSDEYFMVASLPATALKAACSSFSEIPFS